MVRSTNRDGSAPKGDNVVRRRRGAALETALLDAAWIELAEHGYTKFTVEGVVQRAGTSRPVLYRRWPTRLSLAAAAIAHYLKSHPVTAPNMGSIRTELLVLLRKFADRAPPKHMRLMYDMSEDMSNAGDSFISDRFRVYPLRAAIERGIARGEIDENKLTERIIRMPMGLVLHEIASTGRQITDAAIAEIVDDIFLPLVRKDTSAS